MSWLLENTIVAGSAACVLLVACRIFQPRPALAHILWLLVLVKLLCPPVLRLSLPFDPNLLFPSSAAHDTATDTSTNPTTNTATDQTKTHPLRESAGTTPGTRSSGADSRGAEAIPLAGVPDREVHGRASGTSSPFSSPFSSVSLREGLVWAWLLGSGVVLASMLLGILRVQRRIRHGSAAPAWLQREVERLARRLQIRAPRIVVSPKVGSAFVWGLGRPTLMWPLAELEVGDRARARTVIAHELAHIRRHDHWTAWLEIAATASLWWHPLLWIARARLRLQAELASDAWAIWAVPQGRHAYAGALIDAVAKESQAVTTVPVLAARPGARRAFEKRLLMILNEDVPRRMSRWATLPVAALSLTVLAGFSFAQERQSKKIVIERGDKTEKEVKEEVLREVHKALRESLGEKIRVKDLEEIEEVIEKLTREHQDKPGKKKGKKKTKRIEIRGSADAKELRKALEQARLEIRNDKDLKELGIAVEIENLLGKMVDGREIEGLEGRIRKAIGGKMKRLHLEIPKDGEVHHLRMPGGVKVIVKQGQDLGEDIEEIVRKSLRAGLKDAKLEIRRNPELRKLGISGDVEVFVDGLFGGGGSKKGHSGKGLHQILRKAMRHGQHGGDVDVDVDVEILDGGKFKVLKGGDVDVRVLKGDGIHVLKGLDVKLLDGSKLKKLDLGDDVKVLIQRLHGGDHDHDVQIRRIQHHGEGHGKGHEKHDEDDHGDAATRRAEERLKRLERELKREKEKLKRLRKRSKTKNKIV